MGETAQDVETEVRKSVNAMDFALKSLQFAHECVLLRAERAESAGKVQQIRKIRGGTSCGDGFD